MYNEDIVLQQPDPQPEPPPEPPPEPITYGPNGQIIEPKPRPTFDQPA